MRRVALLLGGLLLLGVAGLFLVAPPLLDARLNRVDPPPEAPPSPAARRLHQTLRVADLHADPLLWRRDLLRRNARGQVDVPRLLEGRVALQVFAAVTKSPWGQNYERTRGDSDRITPLVLLQRWPPATWTRLGARALHQASKLHAAAARSEGRLVVVRDAAELAGFLAERASQPERVAGLLAVEGLHALDGELEAVDALFQAGFRMMAPTHFFDNALGGSSAGLAKGGLTPFGRRVIRRLEALGVIVDLAHASPAVIDDVLDLATRPVVVSHTGVQATCRGPRNLSDAHVRRIAAQGGLIGIGFWAGAVCDRAPEAIVRAIVHVRELVGVRHVALGSDFDGTVHTAFDASGLVRLTDALLAAGLGQDEVRAVMGENVLRSLAELLPAGERS